MRKYFLKEGNSRRGSLALVPQASPRWFYCALISAADSWIILRLLGLSLLWERLFLSLPLTYVCLSVRTHYSVPWLTAITTSVHLETHAAPLGLGRVPIYVLARFRGQDVPCSVDRDVWDRLVHCLRACPGPCGMFSGLSGPSPLDAPDTHTYTAVVTNQNVSDIVTHPSGGRVQPCGSQPGSTEEKDIASFVEC